MNGQRMLVHAGLSVVIAVLTFAVISTDTGFELFEWPILSRLIQAEAPPADDRIVLVDIDPSRSPQYGDWPWPRAVIADIVQRIRRAGPAVIGMTIVLPVPRDPQGDQAIIRATVPYFDTVLGGVVDSRMIPFMLNTPEWAKGQAGAGYLDMSRDVYGNVVGIGGVRNVPGARMVPFSWEIARRALGDDSGLPDLTADRRIWILGPPGSFDHIAADQVLSGSTVANQRLKDSIVILNADPTGGHCAATQFGCMPFAEVQANAVQSLMQKLDPSLNATASLLVLLLTLVVTSLVAVSPLRWLALLVPGAAAAACVAVVSTGIHVPVLSPAFAGLVVAIAGVRRPAPTP